MDGLFLDLRTSPTVVDITSKREKGKWDNHGPQYLLIMQDLLTGIRLFSNNPSVLQNKNKNISLFQPYALV